MKKKILIPFLLTLTVILIFSGCDISSNGSTDETKSPETEFTENEDNTFGDASEDATKTDTETNKITNEETAYETNAETKSKTDTETDIDSSVETEPETDIDSSMETEPETDIDSSVETEPETDPETEKSEISENHAPDFYMLDSEGNTVNLSDLFGKPIVLNFWASWCPPCKAEMPDFEEAYKSNPDVQFIMLHCTAYDTMNDGKQFISDNGYTFPVFFDTTGTGVANYKIESFPTTFFIAANGEIVTYKVGMLYPEELEYGLSLIK